MSSITPHRGPQSGVLPTIPARHVQSSTLTSEVPPSPSDQQLPGQASRVQLRKELNLSGRHNASVQVNVQDLQASLDRQINGQKLNTDEHLNYAQGLQQLSHQVIARGDRSQSLNHSRNHSSSQQGTLIAALQQGNEAAFEALLELPPSAFGTTEISQLLELAQGRPPGADLALSTLGYLAQNDPEALSKFQSALSQTQTQPEALKRLLQAAQHQPELFEQLLFDSQLPEQQLLAIASEYLDHANGSTREHAIHLVHSIIAASDNTKLQAQAVKAVLKNLTLSFPDEAGQQLMETVFKYLEKTKQDATDLKLIVDFVGRHQETLSTGSKFRALELVTREVSKGTPGAAAVLLQAMESDDTALHAYQAFQKADKSVTHAVFELIKDRPYDNDMMAPQTQVRRKLAPSNRGRYINEVNKTFQRKYQAELQRVAQSDDDDLSPQELKFKRLAKLLHAREILKNPPEHIDPADYKGQALDRDLDALFKDPDILGVMDRLRQESIHQVIPNKTDKIAGIKEYLLGDDFQKYLSLLKPSQREKVIAEQIQYLAVLDQEASIEVAQGLSLRHLSEQAPQQLLNLPPEQAIAHLDKALKQISGSGRKAAGILGGLDARQAHLIKNMSGKELHELVQKARKLSAKDGISLAKAYQKIEPKPPVPSKVLNAVMGLAVASSLLSTATGAGPQDTQAVLGLLSETSHLGSLGTALTPKYAKLFKALGVAGTALSTAAQTARLLKAIEQGDTSEIITAGTQTLGSGMATVGGALMLAGKSGAYPLVLIGGAIALAGELIDALFGDSPEEDLLEELGYNK